MRIDELRLPKFRNLRDFRIDFEQTSPRTVLVGRNGVGKSNILEALTLIFKQLDLQEKPEFSYFIKYNCNGHVVEVEASVGEQPSGKAMRFKVGHLDQGKAGEMEVLSEAAFYRRNEQTRLLPKHVFGYYSGTSTRLRDIFTEHTERYRDELIAGREGTLRPLFLAEDWHSQFVLLAFYAKKAPETEKFLLEQMGIERLDSVLFILNEPHWYNKNAPKQVRDRGDERYWWAAGTVKRLLGRLHEVSLAPMSTKEKIPVGIRRFKTKERKYCYLRQPEDLVALADDIDQKELFKRLESTVMSDLLGEVRIRFKVTGSEDLLGFEDLSEGEQQLLTVLGLLRFTNQDESLFLLDEPDTHLNPAWCLDYLSILDKYGGGLKNSQIIMTTHSPLVFAGLDKNEVIILQRRGDPTRIEAEHPASSPKGMGIAAILTSEFFGMRSALDRETQELLDEKRQLAALEERTQTQEKRLAELNSIISKLDFTNSVRDPLYLEFVHAMSEVEAEEPETASVILSPEALERRRQLAVKALRALKEKEGQLKQ
jgi:predicted ATPase